MRIPTRTPGCMIAAPLILVGLVVVIVAGWIVMGNVWEPEAGEPAPAVGVPLRP